MKIKDTYNKIYKLQQQGAFAGCDPALAAILIAHSTDPTFPQAMHVTYEFYKEFVDKSVENEDDYWAAVIDESDRIYQMTDGDPLVQELLLYIIKALENDRKGGLYMTNYERIAAVIDVTKAELRNEYGVLSDGRIFKCEGNPGRCRECRFTGHIGCSNSMDKWLDEEIIDEEVSESETQVSRGEEVMINTSLMSVIAAALVGRVRDAIKEKCESEDK